MSALHTRWVDTISLQPGPDDDEPLLCGRQKTVTHFGASSMTDLRRCLVSVLERHSLFTTTPLCVWFVALEGFLRLGMKPYNTHSDHRIALYLQ